MREFRGKTVKDGKWVEGFYLFDKDKSKRLFSETDNGNYIATFIPNRDGGIWLDCVIPETVGQFTGLTFKGVKAFEGDIVKGLFLHGCEILGVVAFKDGAFGLAWKRGNTDEFSPFPCMCNVDYEIVGNIHDNPELLEVQE